MSAGTLEFDCSKQRPAWTGRQPTMIDRLILDLSLCCPLQCLSQVAVRGQSPWTGMILDNDEFPIDMTSDVMLKCNGATQQ